MNKRQSNISLMLEGASAYLSEHETVFSDIAGFKEVKLKLESKISEIHKKENERSNVLKGKKKAKESMRDSITTLGLAFAAKLFDYGKKSGKIELSVQSDFTRSILNKYRDTELINVLSTFKENASLNIDSLSEYGITPDKLNNFKTEIEKYQTSIDSKLTSEAIKMSARTTLNVLFKEANLILKSLDKMMEEFHDSDNQFFQGYKSARSIKNLGLRHKPESLKIGLKSEKENIELKVNVNEKVKDADIK